MVPLACYSDKLSARVGETISFMVSSLNETPYDVQLVRVICADPNPEGPGIVEQAVDSTINRSFPSREQPFYPGSYARVSEGVEISGNGSFTLAATIFPTAPDRGEQVILSIDNACLKIAKDGTLAGQIGDCSVSTGRSLRTRCWYKNVELRYNASNGELMLIQPAAVGPNVVETDSTVTETVNPVGFEKTGDIGIAANLRHGIGSSHFNGKIESPIIYSGSEPNSREVLACWDFSRGISSVRIEDVGPNALRGELINMPTRAVTGSNWDASEMCWRHAPEQYAAIHFHDDDIYDFNWESDFQLCIPESLASGVYAARIRCGEEEDAIPFFVCPAKGKRTADLCVLASTFTYAIYGNHARPDFDASWHQRAAEWGGYPNNPVEHPEYGLSTYNDHIDGSGICHANHRRPLFNLRPGYLTFSYGEGSGLRHFQADSHLIAFLHEKSYAYDVVTDQQLHDEGVAAIADYKVVTTGTHPEYHTENTLNALQNYRDNGGRFMYLGGNGFYWRIATHESEPGALEIRRGEGGIRAWASEPGEYFNAFDGVYGGLWRRNARPPQQLAGIGFSAQGNFYGSPYIRKKGVAAPPSAEWIFAGIDDDVIGDFGLSGRGAAGYELDRVDYRLGSPAEIQIVASSTGHNDTFILVPEEQLTHITNWAGEPLENLLRADMVYFEVPGGGEVFATGSITFCGSLPHNNFDNNVSTLLGNVFDRFLR